MKIVPTGSILGARIEGLDLSKGIDDRQFAEIFRALGEYGVLSFPKQNISPETLKSFSGRFGHLQLSVGEGYAIPQVPEVSILSNIVEDGKPVGLADAGQDWHTDMSYNALVGFTNILYGIKIPRRDGRPLGNTTFANMHAAYQDLSPAMKERLEGLTATHDFNKFWEEMRRRPGSTRQPLTPEQRAKRPPAIHPVVMTHPITGRKILYCNPGYATRINELGEKESNALLSELFAHQLQPQYQYSHVWTEGDVLMWDHIGTLHNAVPDYLPTEHRLIHRCQVMADRVFDPAFVRSVLEKAA